MLVPHLKNDHKLCTPIDCKTDIIVFFVDIFADISHCCGYFGWGTGPIHVNHLQCNSREHRLLDCPYDSITRDHNEDWGVSCRNGKDISYTFVINVCSI